MSKKRVFELSKELEIPSKDLVVKIQALGIEVKNHMSSLDDFQVDKIKKELGVAEPSEIVEKRVTRTVIRRRVTKVDPSTIQEPKEEVKEEVEEEVEDEKIVSKKSARIIKGKPAPALKIIKKAPVKKVEKAKKNEEVSAKMDVVEAQASEVKSGYSGLKVVPRTLEVEDEEGKKKKDKAKDEKIEKLRERFKPEPGSKTDIARPKVFEKGKKKKRREVINVRDSDRWSRSYRKKKPAKKGRKTELTTPKASKRIVKLAENVQVGELAKRLSVKAADLIKKLLAMGMMVNITQSIDFETAVIISSDFGFTIEKADDTGEDILEKMNKESLESSLVSRFPVVTVMGHVDHGKTSLLDRIRKTNVIDTEAGGITQSIGAYSVTVKDSKVVFVDTPGHEAFTAMRARGAQVTDIVILIVAADDGVMPQTIEAINHAKDARVPIIVAINKIDKPGVNIEKVRQQLSEHGLISDEWGGEDVFVNVSAKKGDGVDDLLEMVILQAEMLDLKADPTKLMKGVVIESRLDKGKGPIATLLVKEGTLRVGNSVVMGSEFGKVRAMQDEKGNPILEAGPSMPVEIQGLSGVPEAGEICYEASDEKLAKQVSTLRTRKLRAIQDGPAPKVSLEDLYAQIQLGELKELKIVIKGDTNGSVEALKKTLLDLSTETVAVKCIHDGVGGVAEGDLMLASASNALVIAFNVRTDTGALGVAERENVSVNFYKVIYDAIDDVKKAMLGLLDPEFKEKTLGRAQVKEVFHISKFGTVAGSSVLDGKIMRTAKVRLLRDSAVLYDGKIFSLKRFKDDVKEVLPGQECGIAIENYKDVKVGDVIECYELEEIKPTLI